MKKLLLVLLFVVGCAAPTTVAPVVALEPVVEENAEPEQPGMPEGWEAFEGRITKVNCASDPQVNSQCVCEMQGHFFQAKAVVESSFCLKVTQYIKEYRAWRALQEEEEVIQELEGLLEEEI